MCNRICLARDIGEVGRHFGVAEGKLRLKPHWNIAAGAVLPVLRSEGAARRLNPMRWGLVTAWGQNTRIVRTAFHLSHRGPDEDLTQRLLRRCLVPVENFYEWRVADRQPFAVALKDRSLMALAGIWDFWVSPEGEQMLYFALITVGANAALASLTPHMPVALTPSRWDAWLDSGVTLAELQDLLKPAEEELEYWPIDRRISNLRNDSPAILTPLTL